MIWIEAGLEDSHVFSPSAIQLLILAPVWIFVALWDRMRENKGLKYILYWRKPAKAVEAADSTLAPSPICDKIYVMIAWLFGPRVQKGSFTFSHVSCRSNHVLPLSLHKKMEYYTTVMKRKGCKIQRNGDGGGGETGQSCHSDPFGKNRASNFCPPLWRQGKIGLPIKSASRKYS